DGARDPASQLEKILEIYDESGVSFRRKRCEIEIEKKDSGGIRLVVFGSIRGDVREVEDLLRSIGIRNAVVKVRGEAGVEDFEEAVIREMVHKRALIAVNKIDQAALGALDDVRSIAGEIPVVAVSAERGAGLDDLRKAIFESLDLMRI
ncbi:MAG: hypothetical protein QXG25_06885, partial [Nitrososphaerota archaeon]